MDGIAVDGDRDSLEQLFASLQEFTLWFDIVQP
ncbi:alkyl sulfatase C-terminal domain-containing protein [Cnuibacter physcomitrellae]|nr:alkyl sulfatase C-terminal domain-containing protein [Cnuibacter physcomitrellae]